MSTEIIFIAFGVIFIIVMIFSYMRDSENTRQIRFLANTMDNFNKQLFNIERRIEKVEHTLKSRAAEVDTKAMDEKMERELASMAEPIAYSLNEIQSAFMHFKIQMEARIEHVEDGMKSIAMPKFLTGLDDQKIISLYKQGLDEEKIARELALSKAEVEFALKISKMQ